MIYCVFRESDGGGVNLAVLSHWNVNVIWFLLYAERVTEKIWNGHALSLSHFQFNLLHDFIINLYIWEGPTGAACLIWLQFLIWCLISCVFRESYGEGLNWAGCTLITLLNQQRRFDALDFSYHILKINKVDNVNEDINGIVSIPSFFSFFTG